MKVGIGLIATMTAPVLGLVTASAKSSFDALDTAVKHTAARHPHTRPGPGLSVAGAVFLLEMDGPFEGLIKISPDPLRDAYSRLNQ